MNGWCRVASQLSLWNIHNQQEGHVRQRKLETAGCCSLQSSCCPPWLPSRSLGMLAASRSSAQCARSAQLCMLVFQSTVRWRGLQILLRGSSSNSSGGWPHSVRQSSEQNKQAHGLPETQKISFPCLPVTQDIDRSGEPKLKSTSQQVCSVTSLILLYF